MTNKIQPARQPVIAPIPESCIVFGKRYPISFETMLMGIAEQLALPGFGKTPSATDSTSRTPMTSTCARSRTSRSGRSPTAPRTFLTPATAR